MADAKTDTKTKTNHARNALDALKSAQKDLAKGVASLNQDAISKYNSCGSDIACLERIAARFDKDYYTAK